MKRLVTTAIALAIAAPPVLSAGPASAAETSNGPLVIENFFSSSLRNLDGSLDTSLPFGLSTSDFNGAGDKLAFTREQCTDDTCAESSTMIVVRTNTGDETEYGPINEHVWDLDWSPDDSQLAYISTNNTTGDDTIWRIPLAGTEPVAVATETSTRFLDSVSDIDWGTGGIVFVGSEGQDGHGNAVDFDQLYTVPAAGGAWARANTHYDTDCLSGTTCYYSFANPEWSPDSAQIVAEVTQDSVSAGGDFVEDRFIGTIAPGAKQPTKITDLRDNDYGYYNGPTWSPDGTKILFSDDDGTDSYAATVNAAGGGRVRLPASLWSYSDWQPCPAGVCAAWGVTKQPSKITMSVSTTTARIKASGAVTPDKTGQAVTLTLKKLVNGTWKKVATAKPTLATGSKYTASWKRPTVDYCSLTAKYAGDATHLASSTKLQFYC